MPTTGDVLDQHLKCFGENDLDGGEGRRMSLVPVKSIEEDSTPTEKTKIVATATPSCSWADIENILSAEWEIGGSAMAIDAIREVVADK